MITITKNEEVVLDQVRIFIIEYPDGVPLGVLRKELGFHEYDLVEILEELSAKDLVIFKDNKASLTDHEKEINTVNSKKDLEELELNIFRIKGFSNPSIRMMGNIIFLLSNIIFTFLNKTVIFFFNLIIIFIYI